jgi:hypothetical protein
MSTHSQGPAESLIATRTAQIQSWIAEDRRLKAGGKYALRLWLHSVIGRQHEDEYKNRPPRSLRLPQILATYIAPIFCEKPVDNRVYAHSDGRLVNLLSQRRRKHKEGALLLGKDEGCEYLKTPVTAAEPTLVA